MIKRRLPIPLMLAFLTAMSPLAIDMYLPAMGVMAGDLHTDIHLIELSISAYLLGFAIGQLTGGPLSDRYGRRPLIIVGLTIFAFSSFLLSRADTLEYLLWIRGFQALGGGLATVNVAAIVRDIFKGPEVARTLSIISMITMMAPLLAPMFGAFTLGVSGWRTIFLILSVYGTVALILLTWQLPESHPRQNRTRHFPLQDYKRVITHPRARRLIAAISLSFSGMFIFVTASPYLYMEHFQQSPSHFPWLFGANILVMMVMNRINMKLVGKYSSQQLLTVGLSIQAICAVTMCSLFILIPSVSIWVILPLMMMFIGTMGLIGANCTAMILHHFRDISATANAVTGVIQFCGGALAGVIWAHLHNGTPVPMLALMVTTAAIALLMLWRIPSAESLEQMDAERK